MNKIYILVEFPMVQMYQEEEWFEDEAILLNDENSLNKFGSSAYMIPFERTVNVTLKENTKNSLYKLCSNDESVQIMVWAKSKQQAINLANEELNSSRKLFNREIWKFNESMIKKIELSEKSKVIDFIDNPVLFNLRMLRK